MDCETLEKGSVASFDRNHNIILVEALDSVNVRGPPDPASRTGEVVAY